MRSIGNKNKKLVRTTTITEIAKATDKYGNTRLTGIEDSIIAKLPVSLWDTWECADTEIKNIIDETIRGVN